MTQDMVETFLMIMKYRNITAAAQQLYTSQSTVSHRLQMLEDELGTPLFVRHKGHRVVDLTPGGEEFVDVAERWMALFRETAQIKEQSLRSTLTIGAPDLANSYTFAPLYRRMLLSNPELKLVIRTYHSGELYRLMETRAIDVGYVYSQRSFQDVIATRIYRDPMYVLCHRESGYHPAISPDELPADKEVYLRWSANYEMWHDRWWPRGKSLVTVSTGSQMPLYLDVPGRWAIVPASVRQALAANESLACYAMTETPPHLSCYEIRHRYPKPSTEPLVRLLQGEVRAHIQANETLLLG